MNSFVSKQILTTQTIGEQLQKTRQGQSLSISDVSKKIGIKERYLNAIEIGLYSDLPGEIYAVEFIKKYASFLKIDPQKASKKYFSERNNLSNKPYNFSAKGEAYYVIHKIKWVSGGIVSIVAISAIIYGFIIGQKFFSPPIITIKSPRKYVETNFHSIVVSGIAQGAEKVYVNSEPIEVSGNGKFEQIYNLPSGVNLIHILAEGEFGKKTEKYLMVLVNYRVIDQVAFQNR